MRGSFLPFTKGVTKDIEGRFTECIAPVVLFSWLLFLRPLARAKSMPGTAVPIIREFVQSVGRLPSHRRDVFSSRSIFRRPRILVGDSVIHSDS